MASQTFLWKPASELDGNLLVLTPNRYNDLIKQVYVVLPDGKRIAGRYTGNTANGQRGHFRFNQPGAAFPPGSYVEATLNNGQAVQWGVKDPGTRLSGGTERVSSAPGGNQQLFSMSDHIENDIKYNSGPNSPREETGPKIPPKSPSVPTPSPSDEAPSNPKPGSPSAPGEGGGATVESSDVPPGFQYPQADFGDLNFVPIEPKFIPQIDVPYVDPIKSAQEIGAYNTEQFQQNLGIGSKNALQLTDLEFKGLEAFNRAARKLQQEGIIDENAFNQLQVASANEFNRTQITPANEFNRGEVAEANRFNQGQRIGQLETALPGARESILGGIERANTLAEGRFVSDAEDRAFEATARNTAAEGAVVRGFGDDSVFGRRASELLSAEQRLQLSQVGEQSLDRFLTLGNNLVFDQPIKANPILDQPLRFEPQQARTSQDVRGAPAIPTSQIAVQQQEALTSLSTIPPVQGAQLQIGQNQFQANLDQNTNQFNSKLDFDSQAYNSTTGLNVLLEQLYADVFSAQQEASANNQGIATILANAGFASGQNASTAGQIGNFAGTAIGAASSAYQAYQASQAAETGGQAVAQGGGQAATQGGAQAASGGGSSAATQGATAVGTPVATAAAAELTTPATGVAAPELVSATGVVPSSAPSAAPVASTAAPAAASTAAPTAAATGATVTETGLIAAETAPSAIGGGGGITLAEGTGTGAAAGTSTWGAALSAYALPAAIVATAIMAAMNLAEHGDEIFSGTATDWEAASVTDPWGYMVSQGIFGGSDLGEALVTNYGNVLFEQGSDSAMIANLATLTPYSVAALGNHIFGSGKSKKQQWRDKLRDFGEEIGLFTKNNKGDGSHLVQLADGSYYDIGKDGKNRIENYGQNVNGETDRFTYDIDWSDPRTGEVIGYLNPLAFMIYGESSGQMIGHLANAAISNNNSLSDSKDNIKHFAESAGIDYDKGVAILQQQQANGTITQQDYLIFLNGWNELMLTEGVTNDIVI